MYEQLAAEHDKMQPSQVVMDANHLIATSQTFAQNENLDSKTVGEDNRNWYDTQPAWDDSDLQAETYSFPPHNNTASVPLQWQVNQVNDCNSIIQPEIIQRNDNGEVASKDALLTWSSFDEQINLLSCQTISNQTLPLSNDNSREISRYFGGKDATGHGMEVCCKI